MRINKCPCFHFYALNCAYVVVIINWIFGMWTVESEIWDSYVKGLSLLISTVCLRLALVPNIGMGQCGCWAVAGSAVIPVGSLLALPIRCQSFLQPLASLNCLREYLTFFPPMKAFQRSSSDSFSDNTESPLGHLNSTLSPSYTHSLWSCRLSFSLLLLLVCYFRMYFKILKTVISILSSQAIFGLLHFPIKLYVSADMDMDWNGKFACIHSFHRQAFMYLMYLFLRYGIDRHLDICNILNRAKWFCSVQNDYIIIGQANFHHSPPGAASSTHPCILSAGHSRYFPAVIKSNGEGNI